MEVSYRHLYLPRTEIKQLFFKRVKGNLLDIGFPQLNWVVGSRSDNVIKKMLKSAKKKLHILKPYMMSILLQNFVTLDLLHRKNKKRFKSPPTIELNM